VRGCAAIERHPTPHQDAGRAGERPRGVVLHTTEGTYEAAADWFGRPESGVSAHYLVGLDGRVARFVREEDTARHAGRVHEPTSPLAAGDPNRHTIGIEFEDGGDPAAVDRTDEQYRQGARLLRTIAARHAIPLDRDHVVGHRELFALKSCPGNLDVDRLLREARRTRLACLLPVRNGERDLPGWLASAWVFADAVVALDDGSTDATRALLDDHPLVARTIANPRRPSAEGWHDGANRNQLLAEAIDVLAPEWVVWLDADERITADDAAALRAFLDRDAIAGCAYGLRHHRMWGHRHDPETPAVFRLFAPVAGDEVPAEPLHFDPIPPRIPREAWVRTSIRLQHFGAADEERIAERARKYEEADPDERHRSDWGGLHEPPPGELEPWAPRPPGLPALATGGTAGPAAAGPRAPYVVCLLPVRDGERDLPGWFASAERVADAVVALDDGSGDATPDLLEAHPLVRKVLSNPARDGYEGWDDARNRQRLLDAVQDLEPDWVLWLDADERIPAADAAALRAFLAGDADRDCAYGFRVHRMDERLEHYDAAGLWVYRLFAWRPGQRLPEDRLHFVPVPTEIERERWLPTTIRIQHLAGSTAERRQERFEKYRAADPGGRFQRDYRALLDEPQAARPWPARPPDLPVLAPRDPDGRPLDLHALDLDAPVLSAIVISRDDEDRIERALGSVVAQEMPEPFEVICVVSGTDRTAEIVRERFPQVRLVKLDRPALPGEARNAGVRVARGDFVSFPGSHTELPPGSLAARLRAHQEGHAMVTGSMRNGTHTRAGWASYFLDHSSSMPGRPSGRLGGPPAHCSYVRDLIPEAGWFAEDMRAGEDTIMNTELWRRGRSAYRAQDIALTHHSRCTTPSRLVRHHFTRGRALGRILLSRRQRTARLLVRYVPRRLRRTTRNVRRWGGPEERREFRRAFPLVVAGTVAAWTGCCYELVVRR
jgi:glycosyltransferase involved in cell wall biosynthesis